MGPVFVVIGARSGAVVNDRSLGLTIALRELEGLRAAHDSDLTCPMLI